VGWRSILITKGAKLSFKQNALLIEQDTAVRVSLEDISVLVLDSPVILLTSKLLSELAEKGISVITVKDQHIPNGVFWPFLPHSRNPQKIHLQLNLSKSATKRAWRQIVKQKIKNQAEHLHSHDKHNYHALLAVAERVRSGDPDNLEAYAAQIYFASLFGRNFHRKSGGLVNASLNYAYAIVRAAIGRSLVIYGFIPALGLQHSNEQNAFNLADDLIEPFRPLVDRKVVSTLKRYQEENVSDLTPALKAELVGILHDDIQMQQEVMTMLASIDRLVQSLGRYYVKGGDLLLPSFTDKPDE